MAHDGDVIVIGSGAGGATLAYACARAGKSVILLERGKRYGAERSGGPGIDAQGHDERAMLIEKKPYDDRDVEVNGASKRLYMGGVLGGGTSLYGAALLRPSRDDFQPGRHYGSRIPRAIWDWPVQYDELEAHYTEAERLFGVCGCADDADADFGPLHRPRHVTTAGPLPLHPMNRRLIDGNRAEGLRPFRLPLAIDSSRCIQCNVCAGYICPTGARKSSAQLLDQAVADGLPLRVVTNAEVERLLLDGRGEAQGVEAVDRGSGARTVYRGSRYVLAAGALGSPLVLLKSGANAPLIGRNYMVHLSPIVAGMFRGRTEADSNFVKQVGFADYYFGTPAYAHKLGLVQSLPVPGPLLAAKSAPAFLPRWLIQFLRRRILPLVGIIEDLPDPSNAVSWGADGRPRIAHRFGAYDLERGKTLRELMSRILYRAGAMLCLNSGFASEEHVAHQCGTLRFGTDPREAVLWRDCRVFGHPNVFVVDGSFFPTSLGVGPALTIIANALRVAGVVAAEA